MEAASTEGRGSAHRAVDLHGGQEFVIFFADGPAALPEDAVARELRTAARLARAQRTRGVVDTLFEQLGSGIVGGVGYAALAGSLRATTRYLGLRRQAPEPATLAQVVARIRETCEIVLGTVPAALNEADIHRQDDGTWTVRFTHLHQVVEARVDRDGGIVHWVQTSRPDASAAS
ncbi:hypothetical protein [Streptomyces sp. NPDC007074]|uniref:hypothetical protein n=1 Tax=unclassified Streptomyces TaxID=2593676 RepID=UPI0033D73165